MTDHRLITETESTDDDVQVHAGRSKTNAPRFRAAARLAVAAVTVVTAVLAMTATANAAQWQSYNIDADSYHDISGIDRNGNGNFDAFVMDLDDDGRWDTHLYNNRFGDAFLEVMDYDMNENGLAEYRLLDGDQREGFDYILVDRDENGHWDRSGPFAKRIIPGSNIDATTRANNQNATRIVMRNFFQVTGRSDVTGSYGPLPKTPSLCC